MSNQINYVIAKQNPDVIVEHTLDTFEKTLTILEPGFYNPNIVKTLFSCYITYETVKIHDKLVKFTSGIVKDIIDNVNNFCTNEIIAKYAELQVAHKLGMILYGPPGTGKTCSVFLIIEELIKTKNAICLDFTNMRVDSISYIINNIRKHQDNIIVCFVDEIDDSISNEEYAWLPFLDGTNSIKNCIIIGCTNNLSEIPARISKRPSRIKYLYEIKAFPLEVYKEYIKEKIKDISSEDLAKIAYMCEENGFTLDQVKHLIINCYIENMTIEQSIDSIKQYT